MFYVKEIYFRFLYAFFVIITLMLSFYVYKEYLLLLFVVQNNTENYSIINHFIYTHPGELIFALLKLNIHVSLIFFIPYILWSILDFFTTSLYIFEYINIKKYIYKLQTAIIIFNITLFILIFPRIYQFLESFNNFKNYNFNILFELKVEDFVVFIITVFNAINLGVLFIICICILLVFKGIKLFFKYKKIFSFLNLLIATLISTPEISAQLSLFLLLEFLLNCFVFSVYYCNKINMAVN